MVTKQELLDLADRFIVAGYGDYQITEDDLSLLDLKQQKSFKSINPQYAYQKTRRINSWETFCAFVFERVTGKVFPKSKSIGHGFRSQANGRTVADAIRAKAAGLSNTREIES